MIELRDGVRRVTFALPLGIDHVHCYLLRAADGSWTLVDTGLGLPGLEGPWQRALAELDGPVERIVITHFHPDHVGGAADVAALTGARVFQGRLDREQAEAAWGERRVRGRLAEHMRAHGMPASEAELARTQGEALAGLVHLAPEPEALDPGDRLDGWEVLHLPGHADGHLCLLRDEVLIAGDVILAGISPAIGVYPDSRPDPLRDFLDSLERLIELAPRIAYAGHGEPLGDPAGRARELVEHHRDRLDGAAATLAPEPRSGYDLSLLLFPQELPVVQRRFALAETLAHLERLVGEGRAARLRDEKRILYAAVPA